MIPEALQIPRSGLEALVGPIPIERLELLTRYGQAVLDTGRTMNLMSKAALGALGEHILDSAAVVTVLDSGGPRVGDLGSGAGFPGVVLAILRPDLQVSLVDARRSKVVFLKSVVRTLGLPNVEILHARLESLAGSVEFDLALSRALGSIEKTLEASLDLVSAGGRLMLFKGPKWPSERDRAVAIAGGAGFRLARETSIELPGAGRATTFVEFASTEGPSPDGE